MDGWYTYALIDPRTGEPFYVGKGKGRRMCQHVADARRGKTPQHPKTARILEILAAGLEVEHRVLAEFEREEDALADERRRIADGRATLCNLREGGSGLTGTFRHLARLLAQVIDMQCRLKPRDAWAAERPSREAWEFDAYEASASFCRSMIDCLIADLIAKAPASACPATVVERELSKLGYAPAGAA